MAIPVDEVIAGFSDLIDRIESRWQAGEVNPPAVMIDHPDWASSINAKYVSAYQAIYGLCHHFYGNVVVGGSGEMADPGREDEEREYGPEENAALIPIPQGYGAARLADMIPYSTMYARRTIFVTTDVVSNGFISYSASRDPLHRMSLGSVQELIRLNLQHRRLIHSGQALILPMRLTDWYTSLSQHDTEESVAPLFQDPHALRFMPLNSTASFSAPSAGDVLEVATLLLPYFPQATLEEIVRLKEEETDAFIQFSSYLKRKLSALPEVASVRDIEDIRADINSGVSRLRAEAKKISGLRLIRNAEMGTLGVTIAVLGSGVGDLVSGIAGILGTASLVGLMRSFKEVGDSERQLRDSEFFIPYLLKSS
ncbi:hypothetical protein ABZ835_41630 [Streptomyces sp. NPDC047461]|uniref:hypothetical protein n=1 Tax=Streptomyces sp. NPDC047461 TaxID=3155619 RepID=UPI0033E623BA